MTLSANQKKYDVNNNVNRPIPEKDPFLMDMAYRFGLMALFSEAVYRRDFGEDDRDGNGCGYLKNKLESEKHLMHGMPQEEEGQGWRRWIPSSQDEAVKPCFDEFGLYYETYIYENKGRVTEAVIAFRGTENRKGQYIYDWSANLAAVFGLEPKQFALARIHIPLLIQKLKEEVNIGNNEVQIFATGHSLGGGLAQQAGYLSKEVKEVFTFNTSPVTNWTFLRRREIVDQGYPIFHRIYHGGEFLEKVRFISTSLTKARFGRHDIGLQFEERNDFAGHSMKIIACNFANLLSHHKPAVDGDHHYSISYIDQYVLEENPEVPSYNKICSPVMKDKK